MKLIQNEDGFQVIDLEGANISKVDLSIFNNYFATVLRNASEVDISKFESLSYRFGFPLPYGDTNIKTFTTIHNENELHYDGISSDNPRKVPRIITFYVEDCPDPKEQGGAFLITNCIAGFDVLPSNIKDILRVTKQHFYGYPYKLKYKKEILEWSFAIPTVGIFNGKELLRMHIPSGRSTVIHSKNKDLVYSGAHDLCFRLEGLNGQESIEIYDLIRKKIMEKRITKRIMFEKGDLLIVDNKKAFHGREFVKRPQSRLLHRIQLLEEKFLNDN